MNRFDRAGELEQIHRDTSVAAITGSLRPSEAMDCTRCGDEIGEARKKAVPEATLCIRCARNAEQKRYRR